MYYRFKKYFMNTIGVSNGLDQQIWVQTVDEKRSPLASKDLTKQKKDVLTK